MLKLAVAFVLLSLGSCKRIVAENVHNSNLKRGYNGNFYVEVKSSGETGMSAIFDTNEESNYIFYNIGDTVELTCRHKPGVDKGWKLQWIDNQSFESPKYYVIMKAVALRLIIKPDMSDHGLLLKCRVYGPYYIVLDVTEPYNERDISVHLLLKSFPVRNDLHFDTSVIHTQYIKKGTPLQNNETCYSTVHFGSDSADAGLRRFSPNQVIKREFEEKDNRTIVSCIQCVEIGLTDSTDGVETIQIIERRKIKTIFYLEIESDSSAMVVGGVLGAIIIILLLILTMLVVWLRKVHGSTGRVAEEVIYADIADRRPVSPARHVKQPYPKTVGFLVSKEEPAPCIDEPLYYQITTDP